MKIGKIGKKVTINNCLNSVFNGKTGTIVKEYVPDSQFCFIYNIYVYKVRFDEPVIIKEEPCIIEDFEFMEKYLIYN